MSYFNKLGLLLAFFILLSNQTFGQKVSGSIFDKAHKVTDSLQKYLARAQSLFTQADTSHLYKDLVQGKSYKMPIPIPYNQTSQKMSMLLDSIVMTPDRSYGVAYLMLDTKVFDPASTGKTLFFAGTDIGFTKNGGFAGDASVFLLDSVGIDMGNSVRMTLLATNPISQQPTYALFNCEGFQELHLNGKLTFSKSLMQEEGTNGKVNGKQVEVYFETVIKDWEDWIITINKIPAFQLVQLPGFSWSVQSFVLDKSLTRNDPGFTAPAGYKMECFNGQPEMWNGVCLQNITVKLPPEIRKKSAKSTEPITFKGSNFLIDKTGITGEALAFKLMTDGEIGRWTYTVDTIGFKIIQNSVSYVGFSGTMDMPLSAKYTDKGRLGLAYKTTMTLDAKSNAPVYHFDIKNTDSLKFDFWQVAKVRNLTAHFDITLNNGSFKGEACLSGNMMVRPLGVSSATFFAVYFKKMRIRSSPAYWGEIEEIGLDTSNLSTSLLAKLPVSVRDITVINEGKSGTKLGLKLNVVVNLMKSDKEDKKSANGFGGNVEVTVWAKQNTTLNKWEYDKYDLSSISIHIANPGFELDGSLKMYHNVPKYGEGFEGRIKAVFQPGIKVDVAAMFGRNSDSAAMVNASPEAIVIALTKDEKKSYRYWMVDAFVGFPTPIPIFTGIGINSFAGGAYHQMKLVAGNCTAKALGCSINGAGRFVPNDSIYLGVRAGLGISSSPSPTVFSGNLLFGIEFLKTGGVEKIYFDGMAQFLTKTTIVKDIEVQKLAQSKVSKGSGLSPCMPGVSAQWHTEYNFTTNVFSGTFDTYMQLGYLKGNYDNCGVGKVEVYFSPNDWYFYVGRPTRRMSVNLVGLVDIEGYLLTGSVLPNPAIADLPPGFGKSGMDGAVLPTGGGIAFGVRAAADVDMGQKFSAGPCKVGGRVAAGFQMGTDVLIAKDKESINCNGYNPRGINNWYATGRAYFLIWGKVKAEYSCPAKSGSIDFASLNFQADVFGQLPRPTYFEGNVKAKGKVLAVEAEVEFRFKYGDKCEPDKQEQKSFELVESVSPSDSTDTLSVYTVPSAELKIAVGEGFTYQMGTVDGGSNIHVTVGEPTFKVSAKVKNAEVIIKGKVKYNNAKTLISFIPDEVLPEGTYITVVMTVPLSNAATITKTWGFTTIRETEEIASSNIAYSYPLPQMSNVYKNSGTEGYIKLRVLPSKPFILAPGYKFEVRYLEGKDTVYTGAVSIKKALDTEQFSYVFPSDKLKIGTFYTFQIVKTRILKQSDVRDYSKGTDAGNAGGVSKLKDIVVIEFPFHTSQFETYEKKMAGFANGDVELNGTQGIIRIQLNQKTEAGQQLSAEGFSRSEITGYEPEYGAEQIAPLVRLASEPAYTPGFEKTFVSYQSSLPSASFKYPLYQNVHLLETSRGYGISYEIPKEVLKEVTELSGNSDGVNELKQAATGDRSLLLRQGGYVVNCRYFLPGRTTPVSTYNLKFETSKDLVYP